MQNTQRSCSIGTMKLFGELKEKLKADVNELEEKLETEACFHLAGSNVTKRATLRSLFQTDGQLENDRNIERNTELFANDFEINILDLLELDDNDNINDTLKMAIRIATLPTQKKFQLELWKIQSQSHV